ncbi:hypothetical protein YC2023_096280 [Brassica napus]
MIQLLWDREIIQWLFRSGAQVRSTGLLDPLTRQPFKGKRRGGGIRFGEMERNSLLCLLIKLPIYYMTGSTPL